MRKKGVFPVPDSADWVSRLLTFLRQDSFNALLHSNRFSGLKPYRFDLLAAGSPQKVFLPDTGKVLEQLDTFLKASEGDWLFGCLAYDLKNEIENLSSANYDGLLAPACFFFVPEWVACQSGDRLTIETLNTDPADIYEQILASAPQQDSAHAPLNLTCRMSREEYLRAFQTVQEHLFAGDIYEMNLCMEFFQENFFADPGPLWLRLNQRLGAPFSAWMQAGNHYLLCASPERFITKSGNRVLSQPIKGTSPRKQEAEANLVEMNLLRENPKERAENVMIVDLVRNDLARCAQPGTVRVDELFGVYPFPQVNHLVSTVSAELKPGAGFPEVFRAAFPMGSMTGAPKVSAMKIIEQLEASKRGWYSGTAGYIAPNGNFDFNVLIRSLMLNSQSGYLSLQTGSAITVQAEAEKEYEECLLKAAAFLT